MRVSFRPDLTARVDGHHIEAVLMLQRQLLAASSMSHDRGARPQSAGFTLQQSLNVQTPVTFAFAR
jgi:hypothetical protein